MTYSNLLFASVLLPLSILAIFFDRSTEYKNLVLCIFSALFIFWGKAFAAVTMFASVIIDYILGIATDKCKENESPASVIFVIADFLWNAFIFVLLTRNSIFPATGALHLRNALIPVGAAFFTLKNFSYVYDVYSGRISAEKNFIYLFIYSVSYPFLLAGPVVRYGDISEQLRKRTVDTLGLSDGITRFAIGLAKTVLVVPVLTRLAEKGLDVNEPTLIGSWIGMIAFFGNAYFIFMGLSDMGTGIALMNGFDVKVNYSPITSKHMLGGLVKSYNTSMIELFEDIRGENASAVIFTILLALVGTAFYAQHRFIMIFGAAIALLLAIEWLIGYEKLEKIPMLLRVSFLFIISMLVFSPFAFDSMNEWKSWLYHLMGKKDLYMLSKAVKYTVINNSWLLAIAFVSVTPLGRIIASAFEKSGSRSAAAYSRMRITKTVITALLLAASYLMLAASVN